MSVVLDSDLQSFHDFYMSLSDAELSKRIDIVRSQMIAAANQHPANDQALENMQKIERTLINARYIKNFGDN